MWNFFVYVQAMKFILQFKRIQGLTLFSVLSIRLSLIWNMPFLYIMSTIWCGPDFVDPGSWPPGGGELSALTSCSSFFFHASLFRSMKPGQRIELSSWFLVLNLLEMVCLFELEMVCQIYGIEVHTVELDYVTWYWMIHIYVACCKSLPFVFNRSRNAPLPCYDLQNWLISLFSW